MRSTLAALLSLAFLIALALLLAFPTMWLCNDLFTTRCLVFAFGVTRITFFKALLLNILGSLVAGPKSKG